MAETTYALPSPTDTPYRTPSSSRSRQTSRTYEDLSPATTPPPLPPHDRLAKRSSNDSISALDESLPLSDPRRFTPTLHASLVSEILSLRRDAETRLKDIERYEQNLHNAQIQNETLNNSLLAANRETRQARRQMQILEGGTLSAINELTKERDAAQNDAAELRIRLDQAQKKVKSHEESIDHVQDQWQKDKDGWLAEKRTLETKIHIVEGRLKVVLSEVAKAQQIRASEEHFQSPRRSQSRTSMLGSPRKRPESAVMRRQSRDSVLSDYAGGRTSVLSFANGEAVNLADELALEDIDELDYASHDDEDEYASPGPTHDEQQARPPSKVSLKAWKVLGIPIDLSDFDRSEPGARDKALRNLEGEDALRTVSKPAYVDTGVQYSRPSSPVPEPRRSVETPVSRFRDSLGTIRASKSLSVVSQDSAHFSVDTSDNAWEENLRNQPIMVSSSCQTVEQIPSPPQTLVAQSSLTTIDETIEMREIATQTDTPPRASASTLTVHKRTDTEQTSGSIELQIPTIAIIPPTSRPVTPDDLSVTLPPRTKNAGCQVESYVLCDTNSIGVQTEDIRIDKRSMIPPHPPMAPPPVPGSIPQPNFNKTKNQAFSRRNVPNAANSSIRRTTPVQGLPPINDDGPLSDGGNREIGRPVRSSSMFAGFDEGEDLGDSGDDVFHDDDFFNKRPTRFVLSRGKLMAADKTLDDIEETEAAVAAGKRFALEQIRLSEENDRDFEIEGSFHLRSLPRQSSKQVKRIPSSRTSHMRRAALISSGTAVHQAKSSLSSLGSGDNSRPPMPIPVRYSSARVGKSSSDGGRSSRGSSNASPTRPGRRSARPIIRKTRSGPALSPAGQFARKDRSGSRSPPLDNRVSIVPEMPNFKMPSEQKELPVLSSGYATSFGASAPRPSIAQGPMRKTSHVKENSDSFAAQQTSVVDAIAQTMVGEWMFKYVRRRKSFGKPEKEWDPSKSVEEMSSGASSGTRHKRWVWLAPYEKSVMWSSKQPTDGTSLLGKSGRKLPIKSVLDVKDDNPMPKGSVPGAHFNRSILILTPQRALKFTATTQERHYIWLTALSFLSHSPISVNDLAPMPPMPPEVQSEHNSSPAASLGGSLRRRPIRDSIRIAKKSSQRPTFRSFTTDGVTPTSENERPATQEQYDPINDAALPPVVRRYHTRNRSNTAPKPTPSAFRALLSRDPTSLTQAPPTAATSDGRIADPAPPTPSLGVPSMPSSRRGSEASALGQPIGTIGNMEVNSRFFDAASNSSHAASMTMRMDAFMADQQRQAMMRGPSARGPLRNVRLGRPSMRNLKDPSTSSWVHNEGMGSVRDSMSPVDSTTLPTPTELRFSESTGRGSSEVGGYFRIN